MLPPKGFNQSLRSQVLAPESLQPVSGLNTSTPSLGTLGDSRTRGSATPSSVSTNKTSAPTNHISQYPSSLSKSVQDPSYLSKPVQNPSFVNSVSSSTSGSGLSINKVSYLESINKYKFNPATPIQKFFRLRQCNDQYESRFYNN